MLHPPLQRSRQHPAVSRVRLIIGCIRPGRQACGKGKKEKKEKKERNVSQCCGFPLHGVYTVPGFDKTTRVADIDKVILVRYIRVHWRLSYTASRLQSSSTIGYDTFPPHLHPPSNPPETLSMTIVCRYYRGDLRVCLCRNPSGRSPFLGGIQPPV